MITNAEQKTTRRKAIKLLTSKAIEVHGSSHSGPETHFLNGPLDIAFANDNALVNPGTRQDIFKVNQVKTAQVRRNDDTTSLM